MSKIKKSKKLRRPNLPLEVGPSLAAGGGAEGRPVLRSARAETANFDYTYIKKDLTRIAVLAVSFIIALVGLSFAMPYLVK
jgi:hypothetical protein